MNKVYDITERKVMFSIELAALCWMFPCKYMWFYILYIFYKA